MLLSDRFTYIHEPKTGGTFVTHVLTRLHGHLVDVPPTRRRGPLLRRLGLPTLAFHAELRRAAPAAPEVGKYGTLYNWNDHGTCSEIPRPYRPRTILATVRSPFETYVSLFLFEWWRRPDSVARFERVVPEFRRRFPRFPELSFAEYMELLDAQCAVPGVGFLTERFVRYYFRSPRAALRRVDDRRSREDMYDVRFLHTARLNEELREALVDLGYDAADLEFVAGLGLVVPAGGTKTATVERSTSHDWLRYYTPELEADVRRKDRLMFTLFPELDPVAAPS